MPRLLFSDGLRRNWQFELIARASTSEHGGGHVCIRPRQHSLGAEALKECRLKDPVFIPNIVYKNIAITFLLLHAAAELWLPAQTAGFTALAVGFILLAKLRELHHHELLRKHYVRTYYLLQLLPPQAICGQARRNCKTCSLLPPAFDYPRRHDGRRDNGVADRRTVAQRFYQARLPKTLPHCRPLLFIAAVSRAFLMNVNPIFFITVPAILTIAVFVLYLFTFVPIFRENAFTDDPE